MKSYDCLEGEASLCTAISAVRRSRQHISTLRLLHGADFY